MRSGCVRDTTMAGRACSPRSAGRVGVGVAHLDDEHLQALVVAVVLVGRALVALARVALHVVMGQLGLDAVADLDDGEVRRALQHGARDQIAHAVARTLRRWTGGRPRARWRR